MNKFKDALIFTLRAEGGYVNHPHDPGGATNYGITQRTYDNWMELQGLEPQDVRHLDKAAAEDIYRNQYWLPIRGDAWSRDIACYLFDFAVHSGVSKAVRTLQRILKIEEDGYVGAETLKAALAERDLLHALHKERLHFIKKLKAYKHFGKGWEKRLNAAYTHARGISNKNEVDLPVESAPANGDKKGDFVGKLVGPSLGATAGIGLIEAMMDIGEKSSIPWVQCIIGTTALIFISCLLYKIIVKDSI